MEFNVFFKPMEFVSNLVYLVAGMVGIFIIIGIIIIATLIHNAVTKKKNNKKDEQ